MIMEGLEVTLECETEKAFPVMWYKDGKEINSLPNIKLMTIKSTYKLTILQTSLEDKGKYKIKINNISSDADLDVKGTDITFLLVARLYIYISINKNDRIKQYQLILIKIIC